MKKKTKEYCESIAKMYGAKLTWIKGEYGYYIPNTNKIFVGNTGSERTVISIFCHELAHYLNFLNKKYYKYHRYTGRNYTKRFKTKHGAVRYALKAEIYTDTMGKGLCKQYFPKVKFRRTYKYNERYYNYMYSKFFGGFLIIIVDEYFT